MKFPKILSRVLLFCSILLSILILGKIHAKYFGDYDLTSSSRLMWIFLFSFVVFSVAYSFGIPDLDSWDSRIKSSLGASISSISLIAFIQVFVGQIGLPRFVLLTSLPVLFILFNGSAFLASKLSFSKARLDKVLLIVSQEDANIISKDIAFHCEIPCQVIRHTSIETAKSSNSSSHLINLDEVNLVVIGEEALQDPSLVTMIAQAHSNGVRIRTLMTFYDQWLGKIPVRNLRETALLFDIREIHHLGYSRVSRVLDVGISFVGVIVLILAIPFVSVGNFLGNRGPLLFAQERIGKGQRKFDIYKFRSMVPGSSVGEWTQHNDSRITKFGKFLRLSHLDELPQVLNILRGDLSIVGPRPEQPHYVTQLEENIPFYQARHLVRPGLTGWAQVNYPYGADEIDAYEKLQYEFWYLKHQSMWLDLRIIARTFRHVIGFKGR